MFSPMRTAALLVSVSVLWPSGALWAQPAPQAYEPTARKLLDEVVKAYKALPAYSDQGTFTISAKVNDETKTKTEKRSITYQRPNKVVLDYGMLRLVSDGESITTAVTPFKKYSVAPAPATITEHTLADLAIPGARGAVLFVGDGGLPVAVVLELLGGADPAKAILESTNGLRLEPDRKAGDCTLRSLYVDQIHGADIRMLVDPETKLVPRIELVYNLADLSASPLRDKRVQELSLVWDAGKITKDLPKGAFVYTPPSDFSMVNAIDDLVGKPAPEFSLKVLDADGKMKTVTRADLAGKVVMIDFWATWCGPCLRELPEVQKMVDHYAKEKKELLVIALSEDNDPSEIAELRKLVEKTLAEKSLNLVAGPLSMVALDPKQTIGDAYKVEAIPTVVLIDAKGIVQAAHVGYTSSEVLSQEIDALLSGQSIARPVPSAAKVVTPEEK